MLNTTDRGSITYALSGADVKRILKGKVKLMTYSDFMKYDTIDEAISPYNKVIILFETSAPLIGHYCCIFKCRSKNTGTSIMFFDPYGTKPETQLNYATDMLKQITDAKEGLLYRLFDQDKYPIRYNNFQFQKWSSKVSTCGRWCGFRMLFNNLDEFEFHDAWKECCPKKDWDLAITRLTNPLI